MKLDIKVVTTKADLAKIRNEKKEERRNFNKTKTISFSHVIQCLFIYSFLTHLYLIQNYIFIL